MESTSTQYTEEIDFQKYWLVLKRRWLPAAGVFSVVLTLATLYALSKTDTYQADGKLLIRTDQSSALTGLTDTLGDINPLYYQNNPLDTQAEILRSEPLMQEVIKMLDLRDEEGELLNPADISSGLGVKSVTGADVLQVSYESEDPDFAAAIVNTLMDAYMRSNVSSNRAETSAARIFIEEQLPRAEEAVSQAESALSQFKEANQIVLLEQEASGAVERMNVLESQISQTQADLNDATARSAELRRQVGMVSDQAVDISALNQAVGVQEALTALQTVQSQLAIEQTRYRDSHPTVAELKRQEESLSALLRERVSEVLGVPTEVALGDLQLGTIKQDLTASLIDTEVQRIGLDQRINSLLETQAIYQQEASAFPGLEKTQRELERRLLASQTTYETLLTRLQEIRVLENQNVGNARVIETAIVPDTPAGTGSKMIVMAGGVAGILLAIATAFLLDIIDNSVKNIKEAKEIFSYTLLGVIPAFSASGRATSHVYDSDWAASRVVVREAPRSPISKAYQMLQANLKFLSSDKPLKAIVVSSSVSKEGKSEVSANLAAAMAQVGHRVLLVDADMRHPTQHHFWNITNVVGLSNVIVEQVDIDVAAQMVFRNLYVLPAGVVPPNPLTLLDSDRMAFLVKNWSEQFDFIIFDAPSLSGNADAAILGKIVDGLVFVVRPGVVDAGNAKASKDFLARSGLPVLGMIANAVQLRNEPDSYFYYAEDQSENTQASQDDELKSLFGLKR